MPRCWWQERACRKSVGMLTPTKILPEARQQVWAASVGPHDGLWRPFHAVFQRLPQQVDQADPEARWTSGLPTPLSIAAEVLAA